MAARFFAPLVAAMVLGVLSGVAAQAPLRGTGSVEITGPVRVVDGDTFELYINGRQTAIGLIGIKAPRANSNCGKQAAQLTQALVNYVNGIQATVKLRFEEDLNHTFDARKRRMYYLTLPDGQSAAVALVAAGLADPDGTGRERQQLLDAAARAPKCRN